MPTNKANEITVLGIDPGSRKTGYGVIAVGRQGTRYIASGCINIAKLDMPQRLGEIYRSVSEIIATYQPDALAIEEVYGVKTLELVVVGTAGALLTNDQLSDISVYFNGDKSQNIDGVGLTNHEATAVNYTPRIIDVVATVQGGNQTQIENALLSLLNPTAKFEDNVTDRWDFGSVVPAAIISAEIINVDRTNIKNVALTSPSTDIQLGEKELPLAGTITITII